MNKLAPLIFLLFSYLLFLSKPTHGQDNNAIKNVSTDRSSNQQHMLRGTVKSAGGSPLANVNILTADKQVLNKTNNDGAFEININDSIRSLTFSNIGFHTATYSIRSDQTELHVTLQPDMHQLEEVTINTGYQKIPKERATGAFDIIDSRQIENKIQTNVLERLEGMAPGLLLINGIDNGGEDAITLRGVSTLSGTRRPLIVVDNLSDNRRH